MSSCMDIELNKELDVELIFVCEIDYEVKTFPRANEAHGLYIENHSLFFLLFLDLESKFTDIIITPIRFYLDNITNLRS